MFFFYIHTMEVNDKQNCLVTNIVQNIVFCAPLKKLIQVWIDTSGN